MATRALTALFLCITYSIAIKGQTVEIEPKEQIVLPGSNVSVLCRVAYEIDFCRIEIPGLKSYVLKSDTTPINGIGYYGKGLKYGECGVSIDHVSEANNGDVRCSVSPPPGSIEEMSNTMKLVIAKAPAYPILDFNRGSAGPSSYKIGDILNVRCTVADGRPAASIEWYLDDQPLLYGLQQPVTYQAANSDLMTFSQNLSRRLEMGDNGRTIRCFSIHRAVPPNTAAILQINVNYPPAPLEDPIKIFGIKIGETGLVNITIVAEPMPQLEWRLSGETLRGGDVDSTGRFEATEALQLGNGTYNATLRISSVTREDTEKEYILKAYNDQGLQEYRIQISTMDEPEGVELGAGAIIGIVIAVLVVLIAVFLVIFAKATNRWCFGDGAITLSGKSRNTGESSDTESADASHLSRRNEAEVQTGAQTDLKEVHLELKGQQSDTKSPGAIARALAIPRSINIRALLPSKKNKNDSPENKATDEAKPLQQRVEPTEAGLIYAELSLSPVNQEKDNKPAVEPTEYAEIIYNQQPVENTLDKESKDVK